MIKARDNTRRETEL